MLKKRKHKFMAFLLSAMMLITGTAMGGSSCCRSGKITAGTQIMQRKLRL